MPKKVEDFLNFVDFWWYMNFERKYVSSFFSLRYGRALEIIQDEEYLEASDFDEIRRHKRSDDKVKKMNNRLNGRNRIKRQTTNGINRKWIVSGYFSNQNSAQILFKLFKVEGAKGILLGFSDFFCPEKAHDSIVSRILTSKSAKVWLYTSVMRVGSNTFGDPIFQKGIQN